MNIQFSLQVPKLWHGSVWNEATVEGHAASGETGRPRTHVLSRSTGFCQPLLLLSLATCAFQEGAQLCQHIEVSCALTNNFVSLDKKQSRFQSEEVRESFTENEKDG